jgi:hypothetical protein
MSLFVLCVNSTSEIYFQGKARKRRSIEVSLPYEVTSLGLSRSSQALDDAEDAAGPSVLSSDEGEYDPAQASHSSDDESWHSSENDTPVEVTPTLLRTLRPLTDICQESSEEEEQYVRRSIIPLITPN